jgi:hypothetical protein
VCVQPTSKELPKKKQTPVEKTGPFLVGLVPDKGDDHAVEVKEEEDEVEAEFGK